MVYFNKVSTADTPVTVNQSGNTNEVTANKEVKVVPVGQNSENKKADDADKLPQGYCIEKSQEPSATINDDNDDIDTNVHPDDKIAYNSIAVEQADQVDDIIKTAYVKSLNTALGEEDKLDKALTMIKNDPYDVLNKDFKKGFHGTVIGRGEVIQYSVNNAGNDMSSTKFTKKIDANFTYESKSGNTKLLFLGSGTKTDVNLKLSVNTDLAEQPSESDTSVNDAETANDVVPSADGLSANNQYNEFSLYIGGKQKIGKDTLSGSVLHSKEQSNLPSATTQVDLKYDMDKYNATIELNTIVCNINHRNVVEKTNLSCDFNTKEEDNVESNEQQNQPAEETQEQTTDKTEVVENNKKWQKKGGLGIDIEALNYEYESGLHYKYNFKRKGVNSVTRIVPFAGVSTIQREGEADSYSLRTGVILKYNKNIGANSSLQTSVDLKDKITIIGKDKGNIFTANGSVKFRSRKFDADMNAKYIIAGSKYAGLDTKLAYKPTNDVQIFCKGNIIKQLEHNSDTNAPVEIKGAAIQGGVCVNF